MDTLIEYVRDVLGTPDFYIEGTSSFSGSWDYGAMLEYAICGMLLLVTVISVFRLISKAFG